MSAVTREQLTIYRCHYNFTSIWDSEMRVVDIPSISDITDKGFWLDKNFRFTKTSSAKYWIPASQVLMVEKVFE